VNEGRTVGRGAAVRYSIDAGSGLSFGLGLEVMSWEIPYVEYRTCVENCAENDAPQMQVFRGVENVEGANFAFTPTYRRGAFAMFAGAYTRPQPTIKRKGSEIGSENYDSDVDAGPYNWIVHAGAEYRLPYVSILAQVQQDLTRNPVWFGPSFGLAIATRLPEPKQHTQPARDAQAQPW
jgi:hypothetical protein